MRCHVLSQIQQEFSEKRDRQRARKANVSRSLSQEEHKETNHRTRAVLSALENLLSETPLQHTSHPPTLFQLFPYRLKNRLVYTAIASAWTGNLHPTVWGKLFVKRVAGSLFAEYFWILLYCSSESPQWNILLNKMRFLFARASAVLVNIERETSVFNCSPLSGCEITPTNVSSTTFNAQTLK